VVQKDIAKELNQKVARWPNCFFFSSDGLVQNCVTFTMVSSKTAAFYSDQCTSPSLFHNFEVSWGASNWSLNNYSFICNAIFFIVHMRTNHLATKHNSRLLN